MSSKTLVNPADIKVECLHPDPIGGQHVNWYVVGIRITHLPTGIVAESSYGRSQHKNRQICMEMIEAALTSEYM